MATLTEDLLANPRNPRKIQPAKLAALKKALAEFGEIGGICKNVRSGFLVGGHQRVAVMAADPDAKVTITHRYEKPTRTGTVAEGYVETNGERFSFREVDWPEAKEMQANIAANATVGTYDDDMLTALFADLQAMDADLDLTLLDEVERISYLPDEHDLAALDEITETDEAGEPEEGGNAPPSFLPNPNAPVAAHVKQVQLFFDEKAHAHFMKMTDELKSIYGHDNLSDTVMDAVNRAGVTAALG